MATRGAAWYVRSAEVAMGPFASRRLALAWLRARCLDLRRRPTLDRLAPGAYIYHGPRRRTLQGWESFYLFTPAGAPALGVTLQPSLPFDQAPPEIRSRRSAGVAADRPRR